MLVLLMAGCLTPETFSDAYAERMCEEISACQDGEDQGQGCLSEYNRHLTPDICPDWDAAAAAECLSPEPWCRGTKEDVNGSMVFDFVIPESCGGALLGCP